MTRINLLRMLLLLSALLCPLSVSAQEKVDPKVERLRYSASFTTFPFDESSGKVEKGKVVEIEGIKVLTKVHQLRKPIFASTELCSGVGDTTIPESDDDELYRVKAFVSYAFANKTFAYEINYEFFDSDTGEEIGVTRSEFYVDESGNGLFTLDCGVKDFTLNSVPTWVKALQTKR